MNKKKNILYVSLVDWFWIKQRPHHFALELSKNHNVVYLSRKPFRKSENLSISHSGEDENLQSTLIKVNDNLTIFRKKLIPKDLRFEILAKLNAKLMKNTILKLDKNHNFDIVILTYPTQVEYIPDSFFGSKKLIYDCMDNYKEFPGVNCEKVQKLEKTLVEIADFVCVSSRDLLSSSDYNDFKDKMIVLNNGVELNHFNPEKPLNPKAVKVLKNQTRKKVGYIGTVAEWVDLPLMKEAALQNPEVIFYIIGPIDHSGVISYKDIPNLIFTGTIPYGFIPDILRELDVAVMPFIMNDLIKSVNPVKIYEYLAMGKDIIAVRYDETEKFGSLIDVYTSHDEFLRILDDKLKSKSEDQKVEKRMKFAAEHSWEARIRELESKF